MSLCLASAGAVVALAVANFTLAWTHSVEKTGWQEDWRVTPAGLELVAARVQGSGAGMEPPPEARLIDGWFAWTPHLPPQPRLVLGNSGLAGEWRLCAGATCRTLSAILGHDVGPRTTVLSSCDRPGRPLGPDTGG